MEINWSEHVKPHERQLALDHFGASLARVEEAVGGLAELVQAMQAQVVALRSDPTDWDGRVEVMAAAANLHSRVYYMSFDLARLSSDHNALLMKLQRQNLVTVLGLEAVEGVSPEAEAA